MRFKKVLLVFPPHSARFGAMTPPIGLGYIAQALENENIEYDVLDLQAGGKDKDLERAIRSSRPDLVGFSLLSVNYRHSYGLVRRIKDLEEGIAVVAGGPHISLIKEQALEQCPEIDFAITHEGEKAISELCRGTELKEIKGLIRWEGKNIVYNGDRGFETDPDIFPYPLYKKFPLGKYISGEMGIITSRGCPYRCIFCAVPITSGGAYRVKGVTAVLSEIEHWYRYGYRKICVSDDNFSLNKERTVKLCDTLKRAGFKGLEFSCNNGVRADTLDREVLYKMKEAGFKYICIAVESLNNAVLKSSGRGEYADSVKDKVECALETGMEVTLFFTVGHPQETLSDFRRSVDFCKRYPIVDAVFHPLAPLPNTQLFDFVSRNNYFAFPPEDYLNDPLTWRRPSQPVFSTPCFTLDERRRASREAEKAVKDIRYAWIKSRLKKLGIFAGLIAGIYLNKKIEYIATHMTSRRRLRALFDILSRKTSSPTVEKSQ